MPTETPPGSNGDHPEHEASAGADAPDTTVAADAAAGVRPRTRVTGVGRFRQRPPVWTALLTAVFAVGVFAATDGVLRLLADPAPATAPGAAPPAGATPAPTAPAPASPPAPGPTPAPTGAGNAPPPGGAVAPATQDGAANESAGEDTNLDEAAEGPRRAAPARPAEDEASEFRESADNNISLPVDI